MGVGGTRRPWVFNSKQTRNTAHRISHIFGYLVSAFPLTSLTYAGLLYTSEVKLNRNINNLGTSFYSRPST